MNQQNMVSDFAVDQKGFAKVELYCFFEKNQINVS